MNARVRNWLVGDFAQGALLPTGKEENIEWDEQTRSGEREKGEYSDGDGERRRIRGWVLMDFVDSPGDLLPILVECNFR